MLGHEFVGVVERVNLHNLGENDGDASSSTGFEKSWLGRRVVGEINVCCMRLPPEAPTCGVGATNNEDDHTSLLLCSVCADADKSSFHFQKARNHCPQRSVLGILNKDGALAQYLSLPLSNLHLVPDQIPDSVAVFCEPLAAALRVVEQGLVRVVEQGKKCDEKIAILGDGKLGLMIAEVCGRSAGRDRVVLFGKHARKMDFVRSVVQCRSAAEIGVKSAGFVAELTDSSASTSTTDHELGDSTTSTDPSTTSNSPTEASAAESAIDPLVIIPPTEVSVGSTAPENLHPHAFDIVIEATGSPDGLSLAASICKPLGTIVLKSTCASGVEFNAAPFVIDELRIVGSRCGPFGPALE